MTRILLVKLSAIGDVIHCLPLVARLKENLPDCQLHWLVEPAAAPLLFNNPLVDKVFVLPKKEFLAGFKSRKPSAVLASLSTMAHFIKALKRESYDLAIDAQGLFKSAALARLSGAKKVVGFKGTRESAEHWLTDSLDVGDYFAPDCHVVDLNLALADFALRTTGGAKPPSDNLPRDHTLVCFPLPAVTESERGKIEKLLGSFAASSPAVQPLPKPSSADIIQPADVAPYMATKEKPLIVLIP
ncbi:MAG TPA: glycosyltransferase family 9 protein, partial [Candidatus Obscuribacter sp.]|nr:glycosyltransferase family 9 protein [Candidatus Obscuribacter sp.]